MNEQTISGIDQSGRVSLRKIIRGQRAKWARRARRSAWLASLAVRRTDRKKGRES